jgi:hypothetical protein
MAKDDVRPHKLTSVAVRRDWAALRSAPGRWVRHRDDSVSDGLQDGPLDIQIAATMRTMEIQTLEQTKSYFHLREDVPVPRGRLTALELNRSISMIALPVPESELRSKALQIHHAWDGQIRQLQGGGYDEDCGPPNDHETEQDDRHIPQASVNREAEHRPEHEGTHGMDCALENSYEFPGVNEDASWNQKRELEPDAHSEPIDS